MQLKKNQKKYFRNNMHIFSFAFVIILFYSLFGLSCRTINKKNIKIDSEKRTQKNSINSNQKVNDDFVIPPYRKWGFLGIKLAVDRNGLRVVSIQGNTPARIAGLNLGDYIIKVDKENARAMSVDDVLNYIRKAGVGSQITLIIDRNNEQMEFNVLTITYPQDWQLYEMGKAAENLGNQRLANHYYRRIVKEYVSSPLVKKLGLMP